MGMLIEDKLVKQLEEEAKSRNLELNSFMGISVSYLMGDISILVDIEKLYQLKKVDGIESQECDVEQLKNYISSSMQLSERILKDEINSSVLMMFPHILGDKLFNETGYESE
jgi:hypothetical protein